MTIRAVNSTRATLTLPSFREGPLRRPLVLSTTARRQDGSSQRVAAVPLHAGVVDIAKKSEAPGCRRGARRGGRSRAPSRGSVKSTSPDVACRTRGVHAARDPRRLRETVRRHHVRTCGASSAATERSRSRTRSGSEPLELYTDLDRQLAGTLLPERAVVVERQPRVAARGVTCSKETSRSTRKGPAPAHRADAPTAALESSTT